jgi:phosphatidylserine decarboxylase
MEWKVLDYQVWDRNRQEATVEVVQPSMIKPLLMVYTFPGLANLMMYPLFPVITAAAESFYNQQLNEEEKKIRIKELFIDYYKIDMNMFQPSDYHQYRSVNEWFIRDVKEGVRPIASPSNSSVIVSPAESRVMVFQRIPYNVHKWVKEIFDIASLLGMSSHPFSDGNMVICRLAPQDYHNFHAPFDASIVEQYQMDGNLHSVNFDAIRSENRVLFNKRTVSLLESPQVSSLFCSAQIVAGKGCFCGCRSFERGFSHSSPHKRRPCEEGRKVWILSVWRINPHFDL